MSKLNSLEKHCDICKRITIVLFTLLLITFLGCEAKAEFSLQEFKNGEDVFIYPGLSYGITPEESSSILNQEMKLESQGKYAPESEKIKVYSFGTVTLAKKNFLIKLSFTNSKLSVCTLELEEKADLGIVYEQLKKSLDQFYHVGEQQEAYSLEDMDGKIFDFEKIVQISSNNQKSESNMMLLSYLGNQNESQIEKIQISMYAPTE